MQLRPDQLTAHLQHADLSLIYFISGDEPLQKIECIDQIRMVARTQGYDERIVFNIDKSTDWDAITQIINTPSLFSSGRLIELRMDSPKLSKQGQQLILEYTQRTNKDILIIISANKIDKATQKNKWVTAIEKMGVLIKIWPIGPAQLPGWIHMRLKSKQKQITTDAASLIAQRVEGNLLAAKQEIDKLVLLIDKNDIDINDVTTTVADNSRYNVFDMIEAACLGNIDRSLYMANGLRNEGIEPLALFGAWMWEFRRICSMAYQFESGTSIERIINSYRISASKKKALTRVLKKHKAKTLNQLLCYCATVDKTLKSSYKDNAWEQLNILLLAIAGIDIQKLQI